MANNFSQCFNWLMVDEGGYTNNPNDSGGPTNFGITLTDYRKYINPKGSATSVKNMTQTQAQTIYKSKYWDALGCDNLPSGVDNAAFNYGVLAGIGRPKTDLQRFASIKDPDKLIDCICDEMHTFLNNLAMSQPKDRVFITGWNSRVSRLRQNSHSLAKKKDILTGPATSGSIGGIGFWLSTQWHNHETLILISTAVLAVAVGAVIHYIRNKK